jgi:hypothetical protein
MRFGVLGSAPPLTASVKSKLMNIESTRGFDILRFAFKISSVLKPLRAGINRRPYGSAPALLGGDKPPPLRMDLYLKVAAGFIPARIEWP